MNMNCKRKREVQVVLAAAILVLLGAAGVLLWQGRGGGGSTAGMVALILGCLVLVMALCTLSWGNAVHREVAGYVDRYNSLSMARLPGIGSRQAAETLRANGFREIEDGYLHKKDFTFGKDSILYYFRSVPTVTVADSMRAELPRLEQTLAEQGREQAEHSSCLILFLCKNGVTEEDRQSLYGASEEFKLQETVVPTSAVHTCLPVLVDEDTGEGWFLDMTKGISVYAYACRAMKKLFPGK